MCLNFFLQTIIDKNLLLFTGVEETQQTFRYDLHFVYFESNYDQYFTRT
jgi:hypothetical protein